MTLKLKDTYHSVKLFLKFIYNVYSLRIFFIYLVFWILFYQFPYGIVKDYLKLTSKIESGIYNNIVGNFASILALIIPILILIIGLLRERLKRFALEEFLQNKYVKTLITLTITVFIFNIISLLLIHKVNPTRNDINLSYFIIYSTVFYLILLFPLIFKTIESVNPKGIVIKRINSLKYDDFNIEHIFHFEHIDNNPILILRNILNLSYHENDISLVNLILYRSTFRICDLIKKNKNDSESIEKLIDGLLVIWKEYSSLSIKNKNDTNLIRIFESLEYLHIEFSKNHIYLNLREIDAYIRQLLSRIINEQILEPLEQIIFLIERILNFHYDNSIPNEGELNDLKWTFGESYIRAYPLMKESKFYNDDPIFKNDLQWEVIVETIPYYLTIILRESINNKRTNTFFNVFHAIRRLENFVVCSSLGFFQKSYIIKDLQDDYYFYQTDAIENKLINNSKEIFFPNINLVRNAVEYNQKDVLKIIRKDFDFIIKLQKSQILDLTISKPNYIGAIGRYFMINLGNNKRCKGYMFYLIKKIIELKTLFEEDKEISLSNYHRLYEEVKSFPMCYLRTHQTFEEVDKEIKEEDFILLNKIRTTINSFNVS